jgi:hypothetical protein
MRWQCEHTKAMSSGRMIVGLSQFCQRPGVVNVDEALSQEPVVSEEFEVADGQVL